jgi:hypothetical protein
LWVGQVKMMSLQRSSEILKEIFRDPRTTLENTSLVHPKLA